MKTYRPCVIKSFKHDGKLHRMWLKNWLVPSHLLAPEHAVESMIVLINEQTPIQESDGKIWTSKVPAVSFFIPKLWFNVVALLEEPGIRYYCNVASPPYLHEDVLTYIDYDLDVIRTSDGSMFVVDRDEYEQHKAVYLYPQLVEDKVMAGLRQLTGRVRGGNPPFNDDAVYSYYAGWKKDRNEV
ncbi:DUF402 domain-containing protein [Paenibacillus abyssi]|uniref:UPF0374 protein n=1 Tax=Paenibacillus abyssi TaxID=1340531 RepID=A0A917LHH4_9BACL|nr:DUF402 domain-containing protein [Paenibacillus abyssi]GGG24206.1 UPF0374 protein [Paenibacillus abyssi]